MPGLVPGIHVFALKDRHEQVVDALRHKRRRMTGECQLRFSFTSTGGPLLMV